MQSSPLQILTTSDRRVDVYFHSDGLIELTSGVTRALQLKPGDSISVLWVPDTRELYLYATHHSQSSIARRRNVVRCVKRSRSGVPYHSMRCNSVRIVQAVSAYTRDADSWLFVGSPRDISTYGLPAGTIGLPLIYSNNQYTPSV